MKKCQTKVFMYHGTPYFNRYLVSGEGLLAECDRRKKGRIWLAEQPHMPEILRHITVAKGINACWYAVFKMDPETLPNLLKRCGRPGIYYTTEDIHPKHLDFSGAVYVLIDQGADGVLAC